MKCSLAFLLIALFLCTPAFADGPTVLVIPKGERVQYWKWVRKGAVQAGEERGVSIIFRGPRTSDDYRAQLGIIQQAIDDRVDAIVIAPSHSSISTDLLEKAHHQGIHVVIIDSASEFSEDVSFVATDNYRAGYDAAKFLLSLIDSNGKVLLLRYKKNNASTVAREKGMLKAFGEASGVEIVDSGYIGVSIGKTYYRVSDIIKAHPDVEAVISPGEATTVGCLRALKDTGLAGIVKFVGFDYTSEVHAALKRGEIHGVVLQRPYDMGYLGVMAAADAIESKPVEKRITTSISIATKLDDLDAVDVDEH